jgi:hypothetical protein
MSAPDLKDNVESDVQKRLAALAHEKVPKPPKESNNDEDDEAPMFSKKKNLKRKSKLDEEYVPEFNIREIKKQRKA